jgi:hypothetical protein
MAGLPAKSSPKSSATTPKSRLDELLLYPTAPAMRGLRTSLTLYEAMAACAFITVKKRARAEQDCPHPNSGPATS